MSNTSPNYKTVYNALMEKYINNKNDLDSGQIDPAKAIELINPRHYNYKELNLIYTQLLNYTYAATAREIKNHEEVNAHLTEIHKLLKKLVKEEPAPAEPPATTGP